MSSYSVSFTTIKMVKRYGPSRELLSQEVMAVPVTIHGLPRSTAMAYSGCDNFSMVQSFAREEEPRGRRSFSRRDAGVTSKPKRDAGVKRGRKDRAAASGDLGAALDG